MDSANTGISPQAIVVMGVSGCGKSTVAQMLAHSLQWQMHEGDAYHAPESIAKMQSGIPLTDEDRSGWLDRLENLLRTDVPPEGVVLTCSALKQKYRDHLRAAREAGQVRFVFLDLSYEDALQRVQSRPGHFFSPELVANQFATLERPDSEPGVITIQATAPLDQIQQQVQQWLRHTGTAA